MKFTLRRIRLNQGGYERNGQYYGHGAPLFRAIPDEENDEHETYEIEEFRTETREHAKDLIRAKYPNATFYR